MPGKPGCNHRCLVIMSVMSIATEKQVIVSQVEDMERASQLASIRLVIECRKVTASEKTIILKKVGVGAAQLNDPAVVLLSNKYNLKNTYVGNTSGSSGNPFFYAIDGLRFSFIGLSDASPILGSVVLLCCNFALSIFAWYILKTGYRLRS